MFPGKYHKNGACFMAMLVYRMVYLEKTTAQKCFEYLPTIFTKKGGKSQKLRHCIWDDIFGCAHFS